jgi:CRISPR/Cas system-associated exonuclease Cas4 (RecB family)
VAAGARADEDATARASQFADIIGHIEAGEFPPQPRKASDCSWCRYAGVCRKEYRVEDDEAAESV